MVVYIIKTHANGRNKSQHCCVLLGGFVQQCCVRLQGPKSLTDFKLFTTSANIVMAPCKRMQHVGPYIVACCWPTMLRPFAWAFRFKLCKIYVTEILLTTKYYLA